MGIEEFLQSASAYAVDHGVDPMVFIVLYIVSIPLYYFPILKIKTIYDDRKNKKSVFRVLAGAIILNRFAWALPYLYILISGKNLPTTLKVVLLLYMVAGVIFFVVKKYIKYSKLKGEGSWR